MAARTKAGGTGWAKHSAPVAVLKTLLREVPSDHVATVAAALAYYGVFGLLPALAGAAALWARVGRLDVLQESAASSSQSGILPREAAVLLEQFLRNVPGELQGGLGLALNFGIVVLVSWRAARSLLTALNIVYDVEERRGRLHRLAVALLIGVCGIVFLFIALAVLALPPSLAGTVPWLGVWVWWVRWPILALGFGVGVALLFRYAPHRQAPGWSCVLWGAAAATGLWIVASMLVSLYIGLVGNFGRLYGSIGGVAVVLLWFYAGAMALLIGGEIDAVLAARRTGRAPSRLKADLRRREHAGTGR